MNYINLQWNLSQRSITFEICMIKTVEPVLKDTPAIGHKNMVSRHMRQVVFGDRLIYTCTLKCRTFCQELMVFQDRWSLMAVVSQDRFHCTLVLNMLKDHMPVMLEADPTFQCAWCSSACLTMLIRHQVLPDWGTAFL